MKKSLKISLSACLLALSNVLALAASLRASEMGMAQSFMESAFTGASNLPFSFLYDGQPSAALMSSWKIHQQTHKLDSRRTESTISYTDPKTGLVVRCVAVQYSDFPEVEWTLYFKNTGHEDSPIIANIEALDTEFKRGDEGEFLLHHAKGSEATVNDFEPYETNLVPQSHLTITTSGGRSSNSDFPYFNVQWPGEGVMIAVGWPGQWAANFSRDDSNGLRVSAGMELTHFKLHPGEEVRSPLMALMFYQGDWISAQNLWRNWMVADNIPQVDGLPLKPAVLACSSHQFGEMVHATEQNQKEFIKLYLQHGLDIDYWWMDAGWYLNHGGWVNTGTWEVDTNRFPHGLRTVSDYAHSKGLKTLVWFEPERVTANSWLFDNRSEWLLTPPPNPGNQSYSMDWRLLDLGNPDAWNWLVNHIDHIIKTQKISIYRQDFNMDPLYYWRAHDAPDRQGITEVKYITGYLAYWDALKKRNPKLLFDSCASGGRRLDLETMRRSVSRTRSDYLFEPIGEQCHTYGLAFWLPYSGSGYIDAVTDQASNNRFYGALDSDPDEFYFFRSCLNPSMTWSSDIRRDDLHYETLVQLLDEWKQVSPYLLGNYYPLTPYSTNKDAWIAWQFDRAELNGGTISAFRRDDCSTESINLKVQGLDPSAKYDLKNFDSPGTITYTGSELMENGLDVTITKKPGSVLFVYKKE